MKGCILDEYNKHADIPREQYFLFVKTIYEWLKEHDLLDEEGYKILDKIGQEGILSNGKKAIIGETFTTQGMTQKGFNYIYMIYVDNMYNRDNKEILNINDTPQEIKAKLDENYPRFCELYDGQGHRIKGGGFRYRGFSQLTDNIYKGVGKGNFGYGLRKKDGSGLDFTESTKKKLAKEREAFLKGDSKFGQFSNLFTEASRATMFRQQIGHLLMSNPKKFPPELHQKVVGLDKKYMQGSDPIAYLNGLDKKEIHRAYLEYKMLWLQLQQWNQRHNGKSLEDFSIDYENIRGLLKSPEDNYGYASMKEAIEGGKLANKMDNLEEWAIKNRKKIGLILASIAGLSVAINAYSYIIHGHSALFMAFKKFNQWLSARGQVDNAIKGTPFEQEWFSLKKEVDRAKTPAESRAAVEKLAKFASKVKNITSRRQFNMIYDEGLEQFSLKSMIINPKVIGTVLGSLTSALILTKLARMNAKRLENTRELYAKVNETADELNLVMCNPKHKLVLGKYRNEWDALYKEIKSTPDNDTKLVKQCDNKLNAFGNKVVTELRAELETSKKSDEIGKLMEQDSNNAIKHTRVDDETYIREIQRGQFSAHLQSVLNFSLVTKRDDVLNSLRLVFKEMPKEAPHFNQVFLAIQSKYFKERMGSYDIEALKHKVQEMSEEQLEKCNTELRALLKEIRNFNKNPIINKGPRGNKLGDNDLNKFERLMRDVGKNARNIITPVGLGLGATLTAKKLLQRN